MRSSLRCFVCFVLQDNDQKQCTSLINALIKNIKNKNIIFNVFKIFENNVHKCIACDVCPISYGSSEKYRCIINNKDDFFKKYHTDIINCDSFIFAAYSGQNFKNVKSNYQQFIERTRYLRRDDYLMGNKLVTSFIISEVNSNRNLHIRTLTSLVRHQNILAKPILVFKNGNAFVNMENIKKDFTKFCEDAVKVKGINSNTEYKPVGYEISLEKYNLRKEKS